MRPAYRSSLDFARDRQVTGHPSTSLGTGKTQVVNRHKKYRVNEKLIKKIISKILKYSRKPRDTELEVVFLDDGSIRPINKAYKRRDAPTDVLSFKLDRDEFGSRKFLGEIFISIDRAKENSGKFKTDFKEEIVLYVIHGILHLFGYDDEDAKSRRRMSKKEKEILGYLCKREDLSKVLTPP